MAGILMLFLSMIKGSVIYTRVRIPDLIVKDFLPVQFFFFTVIFRFLDVKSFSTIVAPPTMRPCSRIMGRSKSTHFKIIFPIPTKCNKFK